MTQGSDDPQRLANELRGADADDRARAAEQLAQLAEGAAPVAVALVRACGDDDDRVREWAVAAVEQLGPPPGDAIGALTAMVGDEKPLVGYWAVTLLGRSGKDAAAAVSAIRARLEAPGDAAVRHRAAWALGQIGPDARAAKEALRAAEKEGDPRLARLAQEALEAIGGQQA